MSTSTDRDRARAAIASALARIAPEVDLATIDPEGDLREQADLDSMDVLELVARLGDATGVAVPEDDLAGLVSLSDLVGYVAARAPSATQRG